MKAFFADRISQIKPSFIREILKVASNPAMISFAGGLPNANFFPVDGLNQASATVMAEQGKASLQYAETEGYRPLREFIAERHFAQTGQRIALAQIVITNGSQQALDLLGKVLINEGDEVVVEDPSYLGALQAFSMYQPVFKPVPLQADGIDLEALTETLETSGSRLLYAVPTFQNPTGLSYSLAKRQALAELIKARDVLLIEDNPYAELRFSGEALPPIATMAPDNTVMLGTFSKTVVPAFRLGWMVLPEWLASKVIVAKQSADLHTNNHAQRVLHTFLTQQSLDAHIATICEVYGRQRQAMLTAVERYFPANVQVTKPEGGMFLWMTLPEGISSMALFDEAVKDNVCFVPGHPFYVDATETSTLRLSYSCVDEATIDMGMAKLAKALERLQSLAKAS
ncbi:PLP-dependent aminotransferase family protein [Pokkaliibacter sp. CJK22405]|uniref:aminotransferase-like domain-containing protein n=1 Tax=Pokkaliibacter sp. CJK22405 TaxID=3384615 RepID=UPI003984F873